MTEQLIVARQTLDSNSPPVWLCALFKCKTNAQSQLLLWSYWVEGGVFEEVVDVVVVDLDVGDKDAVAAVFVHVLRFARLRRADHVGKFWVGPLPAGRRDDKEQFDTNCRQDRHHSKYI